MNTTSPQKKGGRPRAPLPNADLPVTVPETIKFLKSVLDTHEVFDKKEQRMVTLQPPKVIQFAEATLIHLEQLILRQERQKDMFITKRFGTVFRTLDLEPPVEDQVIIVDIAGERHQGIVKTGLVYKWNMGQTGEKICAVNQINKWRPCVFTDKPVQTNTVRGDVLEALERGQAVRNGAKI